MRSWTLRLLPLLIVVTVSCTMHPYMHPFMTARIDGKKWTTPDTNEKEITGEPTEFSGLLDDGNLCIRRAVYNSEGGAKTLMFLEFDLATSSKGTYEISPESPSRVYLEDPFRNKLFKSEDFQSDGTITITKLDMKDGFAYVSGRFSFNLSDWEETVKVTSGKFVLPVKVR